jgi:hypothetical protein
MASSPGTGALEQLEGKATSRGPLRLAELRRGRFPEERDALVVVGDDAGPTVRLKHFAGRPSAGVPPWIEAALAHDDEAFAAELIAVLADLLPPGGRLMVVYGEDETERGLKRGVPPAATPIGRALLAAGCTWFKDWYYPEGGLEGELKLQGNKPTTAEVRDTQLADLRAELEAWLSASRQPDDALLRRARTRAGEILSAPPPTC